MLRKLDLLYSNSIFIGFVVLCVFIFTLWWKTTRSISDNHKVVQAIDIFAGLVLSLSFVIMVNEHNKSNTQSKKERILQLTSMNREYWLRIMDLFLQHPDDLRHLADEIFVGLDSATSQVERTERQKYMEHFVIETIFQMLVDVHRLYDVDYLPKEDVTGWANTYLLLFSSSTVRAQWKHSRFLYGNSQVHDFIEQYGVVTKPRQKLLNEMRKSHMVTMIRNGKMTQDDFKGNVSHNAYQEISDEKNKKEYLMGGYTL